MLALVGCKVLFSIIRRRVEGIDAYISMGLFALVECRVYTEVCRSRVSEEYRAPLRHVEVRSGGGGGGGIRAKGRIYLVWRGSTYSRCAFEASRAVLYATKA